MKAIRENHVLQRITAILSVLLIFVSCARNPVTGKQELMLLSEGDEIRMGQQADKDVVATYGIYEDKELTAYVDQLGQTLAKVSHRPYLKYEFKVMDSPVINAFAVPGGYIYVTRGILAYLNNEAELAGVLGHEIGHVTARHSAKKYSEISLAQLGLGIGSAVSEDFARYSGLAAQGLGLLFLKFSRDDEHQSDELGVQYSSSTGYDAREMANFFNTLDQMQQKSQQAGLPDWFSTHPNPADRVNDVRKQAEQLQAQQKLKDLKINRDVYQEKINGLIVGENPRQGFVENNMFYHPDMKFVFPLPAGWQVSNLPSQVQVVAPEQKAVIIFTLGSTSTSGAAADHFLNSSQAKAESRTTTNINGLTAVKLISTMADGQNILQIESMFVEKGGQVFVFHGFSNKSLFAGYRSAFALTMNGFKELSDRAKLNVKPDRIKIQQVKNRGSLKQILLQMGTKEADLENLALINGKRLDDIVESNSMIKTVIKGR
jgi:predicted Zn-dependent protease